MVNDIVEFSVPGTANFIGISQSTYKLLLDLAERKDKTVFETLDELICKESLRLDYEGLQSHG